MLGFSNTFALLALLVLTTTSNAHSWVEQMQVISENGSYVGDYGYMRGFMERGMGGDLDYLVPAAGTRITQADFLCPPEQRSPSYTEQYPKLKAQPGDFVAIKYQENGHVTLPHNQPGKPRAAGTVFIFGTTQPSSEEKLADVLQWTTDGKGGNGKGYLMTAQNFDDGRCYQVNDASPISVERQKKFPDPMPGQPDSVSPVGSWCETDLKIPDSQATDKPITIYWVWSWPTAPGAPGVEGGKDEYYTSCADIDLVAEQPDRAIVHTIGQQDPQSAAPKDFKSRFAYTISPAITLSGGATVPASEASRLSEIPTGPIDLPPSAYWSAFSASITPALSQIQRIAAGEEAAPTPAVTALGTNPPASPAPEAQSKPKSSDQAQAPAPPAPAVPNNPPATSTKTHFTTFTPTPDASSENNIVIVTEFVTVTATATATAVPSLSMPLGDDADVRFSTITIFTRAAAATHGLGGNPVVADYEGEREKSKRAKHVRKHARGFVYHRRAEG